jgi:hypothetical protein
MSPLLALPKVRKPIPAINAKIEIEIAKEVPTTL